MLEFDKLRKVICNNKPTSIDNLRQLSEKLKDDTTKSSLVNDLPKLLPAVFKYALHEDVKFRKASIPAFIVLSNFLDLNKHLKEKQWWAEMKESILKSVDVLLQLVASGDEDWSVLWCTTITLLGTDIRTEIHILNKLLKVLEKAFKMNSEVERNKGFDCWCKLIDNFAINRQDLNSKRKLNLLVTPLRANNHNTAGLCASKMQTWKHLLSKLDHHNELTVKLSVSHFLEFMFGNVGTLPPACKTLSTDCANVFLQLLKSPVLFQIMPEQLIKFTFICIEHIHEDQLLALSVWERVLGELWAFNSKHADTAEKMVDELMTGLKRHLSSDKFGKSKTFAEMVHLLYSGPNSMSNGILVKNYKTILSIALSPEVLVHFSESWCNDLLGVISKTNLVLLPQNILGDIISQLAALSASDIYRKNQLKFLRGIWMSISNILCKWMIDDNHMSKNATIQTDMDNAHKLLLFGAADLSSTWNKFQMKNWKTLYSECVKYFSLLPEIKSDKFVSDLVNLLLEAVQSSKIPLHVAVDIVSIILEFHLSKDASSILPLMMEIAERGMNALQHDVSGTSVLFSQYLKEIVGAARSEPALVSDILSVVEKMLDSESSPSHDKIRNMVLKAQHQLQSLKPNRTQERPDSSGSSQTPPASSPTMTSFLHRLAKAKESKAKMTSPTIQPSGTSSPSRTPTPKKVTSPFADLKSEDFVFVPPKTRKTILTDHQKESLSTRKHDIPALYQDLSQDSSQSALESIVTRVETAEDVDKSQVVTIPKRQNNAITTKKSSDAKLDSKLLSNKENDCVNNNSNSPFSAIGKKNSLKTQDSVPKSGECLKNPETEKENSKQQSKVKKRLMTSLNDEKEQVKLVNVDNTICIEVLEKGNESDLSPKKADNTTNPKDLESVTDTKNTIKAMSPNEQTTPKRSLRKNKLSISVKKGRKKTIELIVNNSAASESISPTLMPDNEIKSPNSSKTPKISPRRLRKRKSGITPILSGSILIKKKRVSLSQTPTSMNNTPKTHLVQPSVEKVNPPAENKTSNTSNITNDITSLLSGSEEIVTKEENESALQKNSVMSLKTDRLTGNNSVTEHIKTDIIQSSENVKLCSPVKVVLNRLNVSPIKIVSIEVVNEQHSTKKETPVKTIFNSDKHDFGTDTVNKLNELNGGLQNKADVFKEENATAKENCKTNHKHTDKEIKDEEMSPSIIEQKSGKHSKSSFSKKESFDQTTQSLNNQEKKLNEVNEDACSTSKIKQVESIIEQKSGKHSKSSFSKKESFDQTIRSLNNQEKKLNDVSEDACSTSKIKQVEPIIEQKSGKHSKSSFSKKESFDQTTQSLNNQEKILNEVNDACSTSKIKQVESPKQKTRNSHDVSATDVIPCTQNSVENPSPLESTAERKKLSESETNKIVKPTKSPLKELESTHKESVMNKVNSECKVIVQQLQTSPDNQKDGNTPEICLSITKAVLESELSSEKKIIVIIKSPVKTRRSSAFKSQNAEQLEHTTKDLPKLDVIVCEVKDNDEDVFTDQPSSQHKEKDSQQSDHVKSPVPVIIGKQSPSTTTPLKSAHKLLKQTQLPFTTMRKPLEFNLDCSNNPKSRDNNEREKKNSFCKVEVEKLHPKYIQDLQCITNNTMNHLSTSQNNSGQVKSGKLEIDIENKVDAESFNKKEALRTPEKSPPVAYVDIIEIGPSEEVDEESPIALEDSEDVIASSQESDFTKQSLSICEISNRAFSSSPPKLQSKSPKKSIGANLLEASSDRVLRSSPVKTEVSRVTPKKSVCRRLVDVDVEIETKSKESSADQNVHHNSIDVQESSKPTAEVISESDDGKENFERTNTDSNEELLIDISLLNGDNKQVRVSNREAEDTLETAHKPDVSKFEEGSQPSTSLANTSPISHRNLRRFLTEPSSDTIESPKRTLGLMRLESAGSPKSPSSRTSQIMELAMQDKEKVISSPLSSVKRRRILPVKLGPILRTPKAPSPTVRTHAGPSEQWVRRTYSPAASPNSSILKRRNQSDIQIISPDSSPPSNKRKRVSFLDPPVSESLLFSKAIPGKGEIHRPEPKPETESEEFVSQGSVQILPSPAGQTSVFSPLKQCSHSLANVIERIVSQQWASELEGQLERLGVTTVGQLSALSEATIQRLPFIPPKIERLQKILQNYYNEINEKPDVSKPETMEVDNETSSVLSDIPKIASPEKLNDDMTPDEALKTEITQSGLEEDSVTEFAESIKQTLVKNPSLITELGNKLDVDVIMSILNIAVTKLKNQHNLR